MKKLSKYFFLLLLVIAQSIAICAADAEARSEARGRKERIEKAMKFVRILQEYADDIELKEEDFSSPAKLLDALKEKHPKFYSEMKKLHDADRERFRKTMFVIKRIVVDGKKGNKNAGAREAFSKTLKKQEEEREELRKEIKALVEKYNSAETGKEKILKSIHEKTATAFDATSRTRKLLLDESERKLEVAKKRLTVAREQLESREKNRESYIDEFMKRVKDGTVPEALLNAPSPLIQNKPVNKSK